MLKGLFNKVLGLENCNFIKKEPSIGECECCEIFKDTYFVEHLQTAASIYLPQKLSLMFWQIFRNIIFNIRYLQRLLLFFLFLCTKIEKKKNL